MILYRSVTPVRDVKR